MHHTEVSVDPYADLDRAHDNLRRASELVVARWAAVVEDTELAPGAIAAVAKETGVDLAGVQEAITLLEQELQNRVATRRS